ATSGAEPSESGAKTAPRPARRRRRPSGAKQPADEPAEGTVESPPSAGEAEAGPSGRRRTRGRGKASAPGGEQTATQETPAPRTRKRAAAKPSEDSSAPTRTRRARLPGRRRREAAIAPRRAADKIMLITELGDRDQIAVLEDRTLVEHYITRSGARSMVGNIYLGRVQNVLPGMEAAFIDVGRGRNAVLYAGEVSYDEEIEGETPRIEHVLKAGQNVLVQVTK